MLIWKNDQASESIGLNDCRRYFSKKIVEPLCFINTLDDLKVVCEGDEIVVGNDISFFDFGYDRAVKASWCAGSRAVCQTPCSEDVFQEREGAPSSRIGGTHANFDPPGKIRGSEHLCFFVFRVKTL